MTTLWLLTLVFLAALVGTATGFGTSTILVSVLAIFFPLAETLLFVGIIHWFGDLWKMGLFWKGRRWRLVILFGVPGIIAGAVGANLILSIPERISIRILGLFLVFYAISVWLRPKWRIKPSSVNAILGGTLSGLLAGLFGQGGAVRGAFLSAFTSKSAIYLFASGAIGAVIDSSRIIAYWSQGVKLNTFSPGLLLMAIPTSLLAAIAAKRLVEPLSTTAFRKLVAAALLLVGLFNLLR